MSSQVLQKRLAWIVALLGAVAALHATAIEAGVIGQPFSITGINVPVDAPATPMTFDGIEEQFGGAIFNAHLYDYPENPGYIVTHALGVQPAFYNNFHAAGTIFEMTLKTASGASFASESPDPTAGWGLALSGLDFGVIPLTIRPTTMYVIPFQNGVPVPMNAFNAVLFGLSSLGPDPLGREGIPQAIVLSPAAAKGAVYDDGYFGFNMKPETTLENSLTWSAINVGLSFQKDYNVEVDEVRVGVILDHDYFSLVPEPTSVALAGTGLAALVALAIRRRRHAFNEPH